MVRVAATVEGGVCTGGVTVAARRSGARGGALAGAAASAVEDKAAFPESLHGDAGRERPRLDPRTCDSHHVACRKLGLPLSRRISPHRFVSVYFQTYKQLHKHS
ncbi:hypothetical protein MTO96_024476 [Rhipicephalus appendiculatus]